jgi:hypothetical protein
LLDFARPPASLRLQSAGGWLEAALAEEQGRRQDAEASLQLAGKDAEEATHREAQALADLEKAIEVGGRRLGVSACSGGCAVVPG